MAEGLRVWDDSNNIIFDTSTKTSRFVGRIAVAANSNSHLDVNKEAGETLFIVLTLNDSLESSSAFVSTPASPDVADPSGTRIRWIMGNTAGFITYGITY
jgi:hypothetical protein